MLLIEGGSLTSGLAQGGAAGGNAGVGASYGDGVFIQGYQAITLAPRAGETLTIGANIADQTGSDSQATSQGQGGLIVQGPGTVVLDGFNTFTGGTTIENGGRLDLAAPLAAAGTGPITFSGSGDLLRLEAAALPSGYFTNAVGDFSGAATIDLAGLAYVPGETSAVLIATELVVTNGTLTDRLFLGGTLPTALHVGSDGTGGTDVTCFLRGTRIATPGGEVAVEMLRPGDPVKTLSGATKAIVWIGRRRIDPRRHPDAGRVRPVRIRRHAFGAGVPHRDLLVSPDHAVFVDGALVCARRLINGATIVQDVGDAPVEYFHLELESHDIVLAEGLPAESYLDTGNRALFENAGLPLVLHPDLSGQARRVAESCAPFVEADAAVYEIWRRLAERAAALGLPVGVPETTTDPALRVVVGGRAIGPLSYAAGRAVFLLPHAGPARLLSRAAAPADLRPWSEDRRRLGVSVGRILWRHGDAITEQPLDDPRLADGWWEVERDGPAPRRWTSGDAVLPAPVPAGPALLEVQYGPGLYGEPAEGRRRLAA